MIKLLMSDVNLHELDEEQLKFLDWASLTSKDVTETSDEFLKTNFLKFPLNLKKYLITHGKIDSTVMSDKEWVPFIITNNFLGSYYGGLNIFKYIQFNATLLRKLSEAGSQYTRAMAGTQYQAPVDKIVEEVDMVNAALRLGNMAVLDFIAESIKKGNPVLSPHKLRHLHMLRTDEAEKLGLKYKDFRLSLRILKRVGACTGGQAFFRARLKDLGLLPDAQITWNRIIDEIRQNENWRNKDSFNNYFNWLISRRRDDGTIDNE